MDYYGGALALSLADHLNTQGALAFVNVETGSLKLANYPTAGHFVNLNQLRIRRALEISGPAVPPAAAQPVLR